jgi:hypothetical protein
MKNQTYLKSQDYVHNAHNGFTRPSEIHVSLQWEIRKFVKMACRWRMRGKVSIAVVVSSASLCEFGTSASGMLLSLQQIYGDTAEKKSTVYDWFYQFKNG